MPKRSDTFIRRLVRCRQIPADRNFTTVTIRLQCRGRFRHHFGQPENHFTTMSDTTDVPKLTENVANRSPRGGIVWSFADRFARRVRMSRNQAAAIEAVTDTSGKQKKPSPDRSSVLPFVDRIRIKPGSIREPEFSRLRPLSRSDASDRTMVSSCVRENSTAHSECGLEQVRSVHSNSVAVATVTAAGSSCRSTTGSGFAAATSPT